MSEFIIEYKNSIPEILCIEIIRLFNEETTYKGLIEDCTVCEDILDSNDFTIPKDSLKWNNIEKFLHNELSKKIIKYIDNINCVSKINYDIKFSNLLNRGFIIRKYNMNTGKYIFHVDEIRECKRLITFIWYLNTIDNGGETLFYNNIKVKPEEGKLLLFPSTWTYPHSSLNTYSEDKYVILGWIEESCLNNISKENIKLMLKNKFYQRFTFNSFLAIDKCKLIIDECELYAINNGGWTTNRHKYHPTTDLQIRNIFEIKRFVKYDCLNLIKYKIKKSYCIDEPFQILIKDMFIVKYEYGENKQNSLEMHFDESQISCSILLNSNNEFEGGGTEYDDGITYKLDIGDMIIHTKLHRHCGLPITKGKRYVLVYFLNLEFETNSPTNKTNYFPIT
jgi:predicted 2-oxoglutarate/Fe(II)-dependent dioxygenase YbiX